MVTSLTIHASPKTTYTVLIITYYGTSQCIYLNIQFLKKDLCVARTINSIVLILHTCNDTASLQNESLNSQTHHPYKVSEIIQNANLK